MSEIPAMSDWEEFFPKPTKAQAKKEKWERVKKNGTHISKGGHSVPTAYGERHVVAVGFRWALEGDYRGCHACGIDIPTGECSIIDGQRHVHPRCVDPAFWHLRLGAPRSGREVKGKKLTGKKKIAAITEGVETGWIKLNEGVTLELALELL